MAKRIIITGGSGKAGRHIVQYLLDKGHRVLNLDLQPLPPDLSCHVHTIKVDLTDAGQVFSAITSHFKLTEPFHEPANQIPDAVVHLAAYARVMIVSDNETFSANTVAAFNVIEAACKLGVKKIVLASSVCVYGATFAEGDVNFPSFPVDECLDVNPMDVYSLSKLCMERTGRTFARRFNIDIYALRIGAIISPNEYEAQFQEYVHNPSRWKVHGWSYTDARDLGQLVYLCVERDGLGFQIFNATNDDITNKNNTTEFLKAQCPLTPFTREMGLREAPMSNRKAKEVLGFMQNHPWQKYFHL